MSSANVKLAETLKVVVDAGNGTGGVVAVPLFRKLGCDVVELYCDMDGRFPNHHPDPTLPEAMKDLIAQGPGDEGGPGHRLRRRRRPDRRRRRQGEHHLGRPAHGRFRPRHPAVASRGGHHLRGQGFQGPLRRDRQAGREAHHVEDGPFAHQEEDQGGEGPARRRDERPHLFRRPLVRLRRRHLRLGPPSRDPLADRR